MKKNWKKLFSVLLLAALLCALPGTLAFATDISAITPDGPAGNQVVGDQTGGGQTGGDQTGGNQTGGDQTGGNQTGGDQTGGNQTSGDQAGGDQTGGDQTGGNQTDGTGSGSAAGTDGSTTQDTTTDQSGSDSGSTATTEATPTPTPTATPTPTPSLPVITKDPTDETVDVGGDCWFIAYCSNALYTVWHFVSPDGKTDYRYDAQEIAKAFPGLQIENGSQDSLHLVNIPAEMNGWRAGCEFRNDIGSVRSGYAVVHVKGAAATPTPSPSATPTPTPTQTPAPTATAAPTSVPAASPSPVPSPAAEGTETPPEALNRGGKIFLLFGAAALVVGAAAIGTILLVSKRMSAKEAYTYKSTRRRK